MKLLKNITAKSNIGLVISWSFYRKNKFVSITLPYFVSAFIDEFSPYIITSQLEYDLFKKNLKYIVMLEPGWAAPKLKYDKKMDQKIFVFISDPHNKTSWFQDYILKNEVSKILSQYHNPFFYHFPTFPKERFIHFPWAVPDVYIKKNTIYKRKSDIVIFGGKNSNAYDVRNWCRQQKHIVSFENSGVENKKYSDSEYFEMLLKYDAIVAAGSSNPIYDLVTPKYFEIASMCALLIGQYCKDLSLLGFNESNMVIFKKNNFNQIISNYRQNPRNYINQRSKGIELIKNNHLISHRIELLKRMGLKSLS